MLLHYLEKLKSQFFGDTVKVQTNFDILGV